MILISYVTLISTRAEGIYSFDEKFLMCLSLVWELLLQQRYVLLVRQSRGSNCCDWWLYNSNPPIPLEAVPRSHPIQRTSQKIFSDSFSFYPAFCKSVLVFWCLASSHWTHFSENILWLIPSLISVKKKLCLSHIPFHNLSSRFDWEIFLHMKNCFVNIC